MTDTTHGATRARDELTPETRRGLLSLGLGNTLEWYDWMIFGLLSTYIGPNFFPNDDPVASTLSTLAVFAVGFLFRPLGGVVLGTIADRIGRRRVMMFSITIMALSTLVIAIAPTYDQIGPWAGVILLLCRVVQGISAGVEAPLSTAHAIELVPPGREGYVAGIMAFYVNLGIVGAPLVTFLISLTIPAGHMDDWGWRIAFAIGAASSVVILYLRRNLPETMTSSESEESAGSVWVGVRRAWLSVLAIVFIVGAVQAYNYAWNTGLPNAARSVMDEDPQKVFGLTTILGLILVIGARIVGRLTDGRDLAPWFVVTRLLAVPSVFLMLLYTQPGLGGFAAVLLGGSVVLVLNMTLYNVISTSLMEKRFRGAGTSLGYGLGVALFGGTASYLLVWFQSRGLDWAFPLYVATLSVVSVVLYLLARKYNGVHAGK
ncbi:MFS transporter [Aeromicrobium piscarium]|uniref:MFS transporter n=1 Tax=Aeromicrobium piscarium TaxID=2590901 RepID=A0A554SG00_9ACTN|nr:MFS transporter [Aeromicrobium piscarium]TSD65274.1 MFS transporter [Aeromicrobium piscarium]